MNYRLGCTINKQHSCFGSTEYCILFNMLQITELIQIHKYYKPLHLDKWHNYCYNLRICP